jgi:hypothetical protein
VSAPKPSTVLLVLALVALVVVFAVAVGVRRPDGARVDKRALRARWMGAAPRKVSARDVKGDPCRGALPAGQRCAFEIEASWSLSRSLTVRTQDAVTVVLSPGGQDRRIPVELKRPGDQKRLDLQVGHEGARVEITCRAPANPTTGCLVQVGLAAG